MNRRTLDVVQGSPEWLSARARHFCASEAAAMLGLSSHRSRQALLREKLTGFSPDAHPAQQRAFHRGHETERWARERIEEELGEEVYPSTIVCEIDGLPLLASLDGLTMDGTTIWENKLWRADLATHLELVGEPIEEHVWQLEHQLLVTGAERAIYTLADESHWVEREYRSRPERRARLIEGWRRFAADLEAARTTAPTASSEPPPTGRAPGQLPALVIQVEGRVVHSNLAAWREGALVVIRGINRELATDQDFADAERTVKWCREAEDRLDAAKQAALAQTADLEALFRTIDEVASELRATRLDLEKRVKARKDEIRHEIQREALDVVRTWWLTETADLGGFAPPIPSDAPLTIAEAMKGRRTVATLRDAALDAAARIKIEVGERVSRARASFAIARRLEAEVGGAHLWPDLRDRIQGGIDPEHLEALLRQRILDARAATAVPTQHALDLTQQAAPATPDIPTLTIQDIAQRIAPLAITPYGLEQLGFVPIEPYPAQARYPAADWPAMVDAMVETLNRHRHA